MTNNRKISRPAALLGLYLLGGCVSSGTKITDEQLVPLVQGQTSCTDIVTRLGNPTLAERNVDGTRTLTYAYTQTQLKAENFIPFVAMFSQGQTAETTTVKVYCDTRNVYAGSATSQGQTQMGYGLSSGKKQ